MNKLIRSLFGFLLIGSLSLPAPAGFTSLYVFGDGVCTTTDNTPGSALYFGNRFCNGRVWIEVLAEWQGLTYDASANNSYFGHDSDELLTNIAALTAPADVATALFVVWSGNADFVEFSSANFPPYEASDLPAWSTFIDDAIQNHEDAIEALYDKGVRTLILPRAVDITNAPFYSLGVSDSAFIRARVMEFNSAFDTMLADLLPTLPGLTVHVPDTFAFFDDILVNPGFYGAINPGIDAATDLITPDLTGVNDSGAFYVFWDFLHPTALIQLHLADLVQQMISPAAATALAPVAGGYDLTITNVPVGRGGSISGSGNLADWVPELSFTGTAITQTETVTTGAASRIFRVEFPVVWSWP